MWKKGSIKPYMAIGIETGRPKATLMFSNLFSIRTSFTGCFEIDAIIKVLFAIVKLYLQL